jgi:diguanylate cyclase (GGDEF)-like protein
MSSNKKTIFIEFMFILLLNASIIFLFFEMQLAIRLDEFSNMHEWLSLDILLLFSFLLLINIIYLLVRIWRKTVAYANSTKQFASKDLLTRLHNRRTLEHTLAVEWDRYLRYHEDFCLVLFDIDDFSDINDNLGYVEGDRVIMDIANMLRTNTRKTDSVARWGEEEFLILCPVCKTEQGAILAEKLRALVYRTLKDGVELSASFAVVQSNPTQSLDDVMKRLELTLHKAKQRGKNCVVTG